MNQCLLLVQVYSARDALLCDSATFEECEFTIQATVAQAHLDECSSYSYGVLGSFGALPAIPGFRAAPPGHDDTASSNCTSNSCVCFEVARSASRWFCCLSARSFSAAVMMGAWASSMVIPTNGSGLAATGIVMLRSTVALAIATRRRGCLAFLFGLVVLVALLDSARTRCRISSAFSFVMSYLEWCWGRATLPRSALRTFAS